MLSCNPKSVQVDKLLLRVLAVVRRVLRTSKVHSISKKISQILNAGGSIFNRQLTSLENYESGFEVVVEKKKGKAPHKEFYFIRSITLAICKTANRG